MSTWSNRPFLFRDEGVELILPVTPKEYLVDKGVNVELVNIHELGDVVILGYGTLATIKISCLFPGREYPFSADSDPEYYVEQFRLWVEERKKLRFIVGNTGVNIPVVVENIRHGERDGTGDVYADITLREYRNLEAAQVQKTVTGNKERAAASKSPADTASTYTVQDGDTLSAICRKYYGSCLPEVYNQLAKANGINNPHLIRAGTVLQLPQPLR